MTCERGRRADITHGISAVDWWFTNSRTCLLWILSRSSPDSATESKTVQSMIIFKWFNPWLFLHDTDWKQNSSTHDYFHMIQPMIIFTWYNPWLFSHGTDCIKSLHVVLWTLLHTAYSSDILFEVVPSLVIQIYYHEIDSLWKPNLWCSYINHHYLCPYCLDRL